MDLNAAMLAVARAKSATVEWIEGSALDLQFEAKSVDVVLCQLGLQFFPDRARAQGNGAGPQARGARGVERL
jgi:ubiquinone/menaquinone biosynthesis C-methylase UbiE